MKWEWLGGVEGGDVSVMQAVWRHLRGGRGATLSLLMGGGGPTDESFSYSMEGGVDDHGGGGEVNTADGAPLTTISLTPYSWEIPRNGQR